MVVAMPGKCVCVRLRHDLAGGVVNEDALNRASPDSSSNGAVALFHEIAKNRHEESGGADVETLVKGLARHARMAPILEVAYDLVQPLIRSSD